MRGLYLITNDDPIQLLLEKLAVALATGQIAILQYRRKKVAKIDQLFEVEQIKALCEKHKLFLIEDASHALGSEMDGKKVGTVADMTIFSF